MSDRHTPFRRISHLSRPSRTRPAMPVAGLLLAVLMLTPAAAPAEQPGPYLQDEQNTIDVVRQVGPSVVAVRIELEGEEIDILPEGEDRAAGGSGFIVDEQQHIITNFHVVALVLDNAADADLELAPGASLTVSFLGTPDEEHPVHVVGANADFDLALLELVEPDAAPTVTPIALADSDLVQVGQKTIAIGNPFGLHSTVTSGIVSAVEREHPGLIGIEIPYIQTDAAINPGNSGGPLLNSAGEVIGINNAILGPGGTFAGIGLAVPSNLLDEVMDDLLAGGLSGFAAAAAEIPDRPRLGLEIALTVADYPPPLRRQIDLPEHGVVVTSVAHGGPADRAGIQGPDEAVAVNGRPFPVGMDVITAIDGEPVRRAIDIQRVILEREEGDVVTLTVWRDGEERQVEIALEVVQIEAEAEVELED